MICCFIYFAIFIALLYAFFRLDCNPLLAFYERFFPNIQKLSGKTVWLVGASTGIGEELAYQLAELNCKLILTSTTESKLREVKENCIKRSNNNLKSDDILVLAYDISDFKQNDAAFKQILDKFGKIDVLINNAARVLTDTIIDDDIEQIRKLYDINLFASIYIAKIVVRHWLSIKLKGLIMVTSSIGAYSDIPFVSAYVGSKKALQAFYRDLAIQHYKDGVSVCITNPGPTESEITNKSIVVDEKAEMMFDGKKMSAKRCAQLQIIAMSNKLSESWISEQPWLAGTYVNDLFHYQMFYIFKLFNLIKLVEKKTRKTK